MPGKWATAALFVGMLILPVGVAVALKDRPLPIPVRLYGRLPPRPAATLWMNETWEEVFHVGGDVLAPVLETRGVPMESRRGAGYLARRTVLLAIIGADGRVQSVVVPSAVDIGAVEAVMRSRYRPATLHGKPVSVYLTVTVNYR